MFPVSGNVIHLVSNHYRIYDGIQIKLEFSFILLLFHLLLRTIGVNTDNLFDWAYKREYDERYYLYVYTNFYYK